MFPAGDEIASIIKCIETDRARHFPNTLFKKITFSHSIKFPSFRVANVPRPPPGSDIARPPFAFRALRYFNSNSTNSICVVPVFFTARVSPASCQMKSPS